MKREKKTSINADTVSTGIRLRHDLFLALRAMAAEQGLGVSTYGRMVLTEAVKAKMAEAGNENQGATGQWPTAAPRESSAGENRA